MSNYGVRDFTSNPSDQCRLRRRGWAYRVTTYGEDRFGNGIVGWCRTEAEANPER